MKPLFLVVITCLLFCSCVNKKGNLEYAEFNLALMEQNPLDQSTVKDLFNSNLCRITPLDTTGNIMIGNYAILRMYQGNFYFMQVGRIYVYSPQGQLLQAWASKEGRGPQELLSFEDFIIDRVSGNVEVLSIVDNKISIYNPNGGYVRSIPTLAPSYSFAKTDEGEYVLSKGATADGRNSIGLEQVYKIDKEGNLIAKYLTRDEIDMFGLLTELNFAWDGNNVLYKNMFDEHIYAIGPDSANVLYRFNLGEYKIDDNILKLSKENLLKEFGKVAFVNINSLFANNDYLYAYLCKEYKGIDSYYHFIYNKKSKKHLLIKQAGNAPESEYISPKGITAENELVFVMAPEYFDKPDRECFADVVQPIDKEKTGVYILKVNLELLENKMVP